MQRLLESGECASITELAAAGHVYQVLTKRSSLMRNYVAQRYSDRPVPTHIWLGVSVEDAAHKGRIRHLQDVDSPARFISFEPLLGLIGDVHLGGIAWAIVGGESGPRARPMDAGWATELRDICRRDDVAFFFKQWGGPRPKSGGRLLDGEEWNGFPLAGLSRLTVRPEEASIAGSPQ